MKKIILSVILSILSTVSFAETSGKFDASGMGSWEVNVMNAEMVIWQSLMMEMLD